MLYAGMLCHGMRVMGFFFHGMLGRGMLRHEMLCRGMFGYGMLCHGMLCRGGCLVAGCLPRDACRGDAHIQITTFVVMGRRYVDVLPLTRVLRCAIMHSLACACRVCRQFSHLRQIILIIQGRY